MVLRYPVERLEEVLIVGKIGKHAASVSPRHDKTLLQPRNHAVRAVSLDGMVVESVEKRGKSVFRKTEFRGGIRNQPPELRLPPRPPEPVPAGGIGRSR